MPVEVYSSELAGIWNIVLEQGIDNRFGVKIKDSRDRYLSMRGITAEMVIKPFVGCAHSHDYLCIDNLRVTADSERKVLWFYFPEWVTKRYENIYGGYTFNLNIYQKDSEKKVHGCRLIQGKILIDPEVKSKCVHK